MNENRLVSCRLIFACLGLVWLLTGCSVGPRMLRQGHLDDRLVVRGSRRDPDRGRQIAYQQMEIAYGPFVKVVHLDVPYEGDEIQATLSDGYLTIRIPKTTKPAAEKSVVEIRL